MLPLVLYDIPSELPGKVGSPNPAKIRFVLSYKNIPFDTAWVEFPDIASEMKAIGAPINKLPNGRERYTLPVLSDPNTGALITDSLVITEYLDKTYPEKPVFPLGSQGLINAFESALDALLGNASRFCITRSVQAVNERSKEYIVSSRGAVLGGQKIEDWSPEGPTRDAHWEILEKNYFGSAKAWYDRVEGKWLMGDTFSYADIILAARVFWLKRVLRDDEWRRIATLHDGKWEKLLSDVQRECNTTLLHVSD